MKIFVLSLILSASILSFGQVGLLKNEASVTEGYTLFQPNNYTSTFLINNEGKLVFEWEGGHLPGVSVELLQDGRLLRTGKVLGSFNMGGIGGYLELLNPDGSIDWSYNFISETEQSHHDFAVLPNGNILIILLENISINEALASGRDPSILTESLWSEKIIEFTPVGTDAIDIVWEWRLWDHLIQDFDSNKKNFGIIKESPGKVDLNFLGSGQILLDWIHLNSIDYNEELDQIVVSTPFLDEIWIIDHSTSKEQASTGTGGRMGMGGDLIYRWGNPKSYKIGDEGSQQLFGLHSPQWIKQDDRFGILLFNNGKGREIEFSTIDIIHLPYNGENLIYEKDEIGKFLPETTELVYKAPVPEDFYSSFVSGVQALPNDHYLICSGANGRFFEINADDQIVWEYINPVDSEFNCSDTSPASIQNTVFRAKKYSLDYPGLPPLIENPSILSNLGCLVTGVKTYLGYRLNVSQKSIQLDGLSEPVLLKLYSLDGRAILERFFTNENNVTSISHLNSGTYVVKINNSRGIYTGKFLIK